MGIANIVYKSKTKRFQPGHLRFFYVITWQMYVFFRTLSDTNFRNRQWFALKYQQNYHQFSTFTIPNRYPDLFEILKDYCDDKQNLKIMSFGCSTGEEAATISDYVPHAEVVGVDINKWCLKEAKKKYARPGIKFTHSLEKEYSEENDFDAILCLAVFQQPQNRHNSTLFETKYLFSNFEKQLVELNQKLKSGGLLLIDQCDFNFLETKIAKNYQIFNCKNNHKLRQRPLFNRKNKKIAMVQNNFRVFIKN